MPKGYPLPQESPEEKKARLRSYVDRYRANHPERVRRSKQQANKVAWQKTDKVVHNKKQRDRRRADPKREKERARREHERNPIALFARRLKKYGLTPEKYAALLAKQGGVCAICRRPQQIPGKRLAVDHDHKTLRVRGLLCDRCNVGIGHLNEDKQLLLAAIDYLERGHAEEVEASASTS